MAWGAVDERAVGARFGEEGLDNLGALFAGDEDRADLEEDDELGAFGPLCALHGWVGPAGPGVALRFEVRTELDPSIGGIELRLREDGRYVRSALPSLRDRHGDLTLRLPLPRETADGAEALAWLPYAALPRRVGSEVVLEGWLVEDGEPIDELLWPIELPALEDRLLENALGAVSVAAISARAARTRGAGRHALVETGTGPIEAALERLFRLDPTGRVVAAQLVGAGVPEAVGAVAARLRAQVAPAGLRTVLGLLHELSASPGELAFLEVLATRLGIPAGPAPKRRAPRPDRGTRVARGAALVGPLRVLDLAEGATWDEIRAAYRQAATTHHPDRAPGLSAGELAAATERMKRINAAYATLRKAIGGR